MSYEAKCKYINEKKYINEQSNSECKLFCISTVCYDYYLYSHLVRNASPNFIDNNE